MIQRVVLIKLKPDYASSEDRRLVIEKTKKVLPQARGVVSLKAGPAADDWTGEAWDLCLFIRFRSIDDIEPYRTDPVHRSYVDVFLKPMLEKLKVYNFELSEDRLADIL